MWYLVLGSFALVFFVFALVKVTEAEISDLPDSIARLYIGRPPGACAT